MAVEHPAPRSFRVEALLSYLHGGACVGNFVVLSGAFTLLPFFESFDD